MKFNVKNKQDLEEKLPLHKLWINDSSTGERLMCVSGADLSGADLRSANLRSADLSVADLSGANLSGAYLSGAELPVVTICKWEISVTEKIVRIGCKSNTTTAWRKFFKAKESIRTDPDSDEYSLIELGFKQAVIAQRALKIRSKKGSNQCQ